MGAELLIEGRTAGWAQCKEKMLALIKAKLPELDTNLIDPNLMTSEEAEDVTPPKDRLDPTILLEGTTKDRSSTKDLEA